MQPLFSRKAMTLSFIEGNRDTFERKLLETIWLGSSEEAERMIAKLQTLPKARLRLVEKHPLSVGPENQE
jgi:hypothetical protein